MGAVVKKSVSVAAEVWSAAEAAAAEDHITISAVVAEALENHLAIRAGLRAVRDWEQEHGPLTAAELADADALLESVNVGRTA
jgi:hypothetical protein